MHDRLHPDAGDDVADEVLLTRVAAGDHDAFTVLVQRHREMVFAVCWRFFRNDNDAQDATQEAFTAMYQGAASFGGTSKLSTWLYRIATNTCHDITRKRVRRPQSAGIDPNLLATPAREEYSAVELGIDVRRALQQLRPDHRDVLVMHWLEGLAYGEIGDRLGVAVGTVKSRVHRAHASLAAVMTADGWEPSGRGVRQMPDPPLPLT